jgi:ubiquinone/menaquinone biosynthesis C-methylase UbiE
MKQIISRSIPYRLKAQLHRAYNFLSYNVGVRTGRRDPLLPPYWLHCVGDGDYIQIGEEFFQYFVDMAGLKPQERVLDVGCGTGRMARPLTRYLKAGSYHGIDIVAPSIRWCQKTYARRYPNFHFHFTDLYNKAYNPTGSCQASEYHFPFETASFDFVFLTSVFTHLLPQDMENYLSEIARVLKQGGRCLITYFLLTPESLKLIEEKAGTITFGYPLQGCRVDNIDVPEAAVAYDESKIRELYEKHELNISEPISYGSWCGRKNGLSYQDIVVASKAR